MTKMMLAAATFTLFSCCAGGPREYSCTCVVVGCRSAWTGTVCVAEEVRTTDAEECRFESTVQTVCYNSIYGDEELRDDPRWKDCFIECTDCDCRHIGDDCEDPTGCID